MKRNAWIRRSLAWLMVFALLAGLPALSRGEELIGSEEEMLALLSRYRKQGTEAFQVKLTGGYFARLSENNFQEYTAVRLKAGIAEADMGYNADYCILFLEGVQWTEPHALEVSTEQEFRKAIQFFMGQGIYDFQVIARDGRLFESLKNNSRAFQYAAMYGAETLQVRTLGDASPYIFFLDGFELFAGPWYCVSSGDEWIRAVEAMAERNETSFTLVLDPFFAETLQRDESLIGALQARSPMAEWKSSYRTDYTRFEFTDVVFSADPRIVCETEEELTEAIRQMGASGISGFTLVLPEDLFAAVSADDFSRLRALEADAGMSDGDLRYSPNLYTLTYSGAVIDSDAVKLETAQQVTARLEQAVAAGEERIALFCTGEVYDLLIGDLSGQTGGANLLPICDALAHAGVFRYTYTYSRASGMIKIDVEALYPGTKILRAVQQGKEGSLTPREAETLAAARALASACRSNDPLETVRKIHDALCDRIVYTSDEDMDEDDTAVGALLNGQANCDGYSDAFFLVGRLAGLEVRYQHGDSREKGTDEKNRDVSHLWNLVRIGGAWYLVDVTWDDQDYGTIYTWFCIGADKARQSHIWNEEMSVPLAEKTAP